MTDAVSVISVEFSMSTYHQICWSYHWNMIIALIILTGLLGFLIFPLKFLYLYFSLIALGLCMAMHSSWGTTCHNLCPHVTTWNKDRVLILIFQYSVSVYSNNSVSVYPKQFLLPFRIVWRRQIDLNKCSLCLIVFTDRWLLISGPVMASYSSANL